ncbi:MAG: hypothetical protein U5K84_02635 [Alkalibacterium sp.]|nr:hypothetical protein [Alkalibacterium sp.]
MDSLKFDDLSKPDDFEEDKSEGSAFFWLSDERKKAILIRMTAR